MKQERLPLVLFGILFIVLFIGSSYYVEPVKASTLRLSGQLMERRPLEMDVIQNNQIMSPDSDSEPRVDNSLVLESLPREMLERDLQGPLQIGNEGLSSVVQDSSDYNLTCKSDITVGETIWCGIDIYPNLEPHHLEYVKAGGDDQWHLWPQEWEMCVYDYVHGALVGRDCYLTTNANVLVYHDDLTEDYWGNIILEHRDYYLYENLSAGTYNVRGCDSSSCQSVLFTGSFVVNEPPGPEMDVQGKGTSIADEDASPSTADGTDFGEVNTSSEPAAQTFTIENTGDEDLNLIGSPKVEITGADAGDFTVTSQPSSPVPSGGGTATFEITFDPSAEGLREAEVSIANDDSDENPYNFAIQGTGVATETKPKADFDGDGDTDLAVFKVEPWGGMWYIKDQTAHGYGDSGSIPVPGDYDGDGTTDVAVYNDGTWYVKDQFVDTWGDADSIPVPGDYDGDGTTDLAVFKVEAWGGMWYIKDQTAHGYGDSGSIPVPGDYNGDGTTDVAVFNDGTWYVKDQFVDTWGDADSIPVPGDYDGDGTTDLAVFKVEAWGGMWYIKDQAAHGYGNSESIPVPGDYDGDGIIDVAVYNDGTWYVKDQFVDTWGDATSYPLPAPDTNGDGDPYQ